MAYGCADGHLAVPAARTNVLREAWDLYRETEDAGLGKLDSSALLAYLKGKKPS